MDSGVGPAVGPAVELIISSGNKFPSLNAHVQSLWSEFSLIFDTSITMPRVPLAMCHGSGSALEPRSVTTVVDELNGAPSVISVLSFGHMRRKAYTNLPSFDDVYLKREKEISNLSVSYQIYQTSELVVSF